MNNNRVQIEDVSLIKECEEWCSLEIGIECQTWIRSIDYDTFYFKHEEDKVKFILKWL